jgi:hypothetical protein
MPDSEGKLTQDEKARVVQRVTSMWRDHTCPHCGNPNWLVGDHLVQPITLGPNNSIQLGGGAGYPQVMLISVGCGYTRFFNAVVLGILPAASPEGTPAVPEGTSDVKS